MSYVLYVYVLGRDWEESLTLGTLVAHVVGL
jgi:hypothetical protein